MKPVTFYRELKRRNVLRAGVLYSGAVWALAQGISQLGPSLGLPDWATRWFLVAAVIGFPFWMAFAWFYELTPSGLKRETEIDAAVSVTHSTGRKLDFLIIGVLGVAVVLLLTNQLVARRSADVVIAVPSQSVAVLPLINESGDASQQYFSDGLSEDLITALSQFKGLKVIGRNSAFQFRHSEDDSQTIGRKLGVAQLLEGSVRRAGDTVRISAELIKVTDGSTSWSEHYDRPYKDLFALQDEITHAVAGALQTKLLPVSGSAAQGDHPPGGDVAAYNAYLRGKFYVARNTEADQHLAIDQFDQALRIDPHYAVAYAALSLSWNSLATGFLDGAPARRAYASARADADIALALRPDLAVAHAARGYLLLNADLDWNAANDAFQRAAQLAPNDGEIAFRLGTLQAALGHTEEAVLLTRNALTADPLNARWYNWLSTYLSGLGRLDEAEAAIRRAIALQPAATSYYYQLAIIDIQRGDAGAAMQSAQKEPPGSWQQDALTLALQIGPDRAAADAALKSLIDKQGDLSAYQVAEVFALRKDPDNTFAWLDRAWVNRDPGIANLLSDPFILNYRNDPRFAVYCRKVGLPVPDAPPHVAVAVPIDQPATASTAAVVATP